MRAGKEMVGNTNRKENVNEIFVQQISSKIKKIFSPYFHSFSFSVWLLHLFASFFTYLPIHRLLHPPAASLRE
jgi:hypothetical protein